MIDLRNRELPNAITVDGNSFLIQTDFRYWIEFSEKIKNKDVKYKELEYLFVNKTPKTFYMKQLMDFYINANPIPKIESTNSDPILDYIIDGEYIYASFMQAYNIDLLSCNMHWHIFKALLNGLPSNTYIKEIMSMRAYKKSNKNYEQTQRELKEAWRLPLNYNKEQEDIMKEINEEFYNS